MFYNVEPLSKIKFLNTGNQKELVIDDKFFVNKYIRIDYFESNVTDHIMRFSTPTNWIDPYEQLYYKRTFYKKILNFDPPDIHCLCLTQNNYKNEDAMWSIYRYGTTESVIKITYNLYEFLKQINDFCVNNKFTLYIGQIDYSYSETAIECFINKQKNLENYNHFFPQNFTLPNYLNLLLIKRKQFEYENEIRLFLISDKNQIDEDIIEVPLNYSDTKLISSIRIDPVTPEKKNETRCASYRSRNTKHANEIKKKIQTFLDIEHKKLQQCRLYEPIVIEKLTKEMREEIFKRDNYKCIICGSTERLGIDHTIPIRLGGDSFIGNFATLCAVCNIKKAAKFER